MARFGTVSSKLILWQWHATNVLVYNDMYIRTEISDECRVNAAAFSQMACRMETSVIEFQVRTTLTISKTFTFK